jgi:CheY-like chemotaxis protein
MNSTKEMVLIVDDSPADIKILAELLYSSYSTLFAKDGETALLIAKERRPDLILLDILMPGIDGYEVHSRLKSDSSTKDIPVIFVTALDQEENEITGLELGAVDYISKPYSPAIVRARVRNCLAMHRALRMQEDVDRMIRHDIKHPIGAILGFADLLLEEKDLPPMVAENISAIRCASFRALAILNNSLDIYALESGQYRMQAVPVDGLAVLRKTIREVQSRKGAGVGIDLLVEGRAPEEGARFLLRAEELLLYSLLTNLLINAVEASPDNERITVCLERAQPGAGAITIHNKGVVPLAVRARFFEKYVTAGKPGGMGLGAYTARLMARAMGGDVAMSSSDSENDTLLRVTLPLTFSTEPIEEPKPAESPAAISPEALPPLSILLIDDSEMTHFFIRAYLKGAPCSLDAVLTGETGLERFKTKPYDVLLLDHYLPDFKGDEVLRRLRDWERSQGKSPTPVLSITGMDDALEPNPEVVPGYEGHLTKPIDRDSFLRVLLSFPAAAHVIDITGSGK